MIQVVKSVFQIFLFTISTGLIAQEDSLLQALKVDEKLHAETNDLNDTLTVLEMNKAFESLIYTNPEKAELYALKLYQLSIKLDYTIGIAKGLRHIGDAKMIRNELDSGIYFIDLSIEYANKYNLQEELMNGYTSAGNGHFYKNEYNMAIDMYFKSVEIADEYYPTNSGSSYSSIGLVFRVIGNNEKAKKYCEQGYQLSVLYKDTSTQTFVLNNLGIIAKNDGEHEKALEYYETGLELSILTNNTRREGEIVYNMAIVYFALDNTEKALELLERSSEITKLIGNNRDRAIEHGELALRYQDFGKYYEAIKHANTALEFAILSEYWEVELEALNVLAESHYEIGKYKKAYEFSNRAHDLKDSVKLENLSSSVLEVENQFENEKIALADSLENVQHELEREYDKTLNDEKLKSRDRLLMVSVIIILLIIIGLFLLYRGLKRIKAKNLIITERNNQIVKQKEEIEEQHQEITDSINYAQKIQNALLTGQDEWEKIGSDRFIYFRPKDIVSGDFYWAQHIEDKNLSIWVAADCTGHGVPGAFMSMLGIGFLNEIVLENEIVNGPEILHMLRSKIIQALEQKNVDTRQKDGMDMALCIWNKNTNEEILKQPIYWRGFFLDKSS